VSVAEFSIVSGQLWWLISFYVRPFMMAVIIGLMWLRVMGFLKVVNEQLATFILALRQVRNELG
jgi:hypothetical protein